MEQFRLESSFFSILKRIMLIVIGSGLVTNAFYIYGLAFYEGYIQRAGFDFNLFPIDWDSAIFWTYHASRDLGFSSVNKLGEFSTTAILMILGVFYFIVRLWMEVSVSSSQKKLNKKDFTFDFALARKVYNLKLNHKWKYYLLFKPLRWLFITEQSVVAFFASYFFLVFLVFIPVFVFIWSYFPIVGLYHGEQFAVERLSFYESNLCGKEDDYWNKCVSIDTSHLAASDLPSQINGKLIVKRGNLLGILTEDGPITLTLPKSFYFRTQKNSKNH